MAMGIVSDADFNKELERAIPIAQDVIEGEVVELPSPGRKEGDNNVPDSLRKIIGETSELDGRQEALALAHNFGVSESSVSAYANGSKSTASYDSQPNKPHIDHARTRIQTRARKILFRSLKHITEDKLSAQPPLALAGIAKQMSGIIKELEPEKEQDNKPLAQFVIMCPPSKDESSYEHIPSRDGL